MAGDKKKALKAGCTGYVEKPINPDTLLGEIKKYL
jgi:CheY-like chemotaxis protein